MMPRSHAAVALLVTLVACQDRGTPGTAGETMATTTTTGSSSTSGATTTSTTAPTSSSTTGSTASTGSTSSSSTAAPTTGDATTTTGGPQTCVIETNNCPKGHVCCQLDFLDPPHCEPLRAGQCGDDKDCRDGFECTPGGVECPIGECVPAETSSTGTTAGSSSGSSSSTG